MSGVLAVLATGSPPLAASAAPTGPNGVKIGTGTVITSSSVMVTAVGGTVPYTYLWTFVSGDTEIGPINGTSSSTKFSAYFSTPGTFEAVYKCVVTDATATAVDTNPVTIYMESFL